MTPQSIPEDLESVRDFVHQLRALEAPAPDEALAQRVGVATSGHHTRSAAGASLASSRIESRSVPRTRWRIGVLAAGLAAIAGIRLWKPTSSAPLVPTTVAAPRATTTSRAAGAAPGALAQLLSPFPSLAFAQSPTAARPVPYEPASGIDARRLKAGVRSYLRLSANDYHGFIPDSRMETSLQRVTRRGRDAWRLVTTTPVARRLDVQLPSPKFATIVDTSWLDASTLRPIERHVVAGVMDVSEQYTAIERAQTITMDIPSARLPKNAKRPLNGPFVSRHPVSTSHPYVATEDGLRLLLRTLPLRDGWRGSIAVPAQEGGTLRNFGKPLTVNLRVAGADTVQLFTGRYACWRVVFELGDKPVVWSVSQETGETLITDGPNGLSYPESRTYLMYGLEETKQLPSIRRR